MTCNRNKKRPYIFIRPFLMVMRKIVFILFISFCTAQNFFYSEDDWLIITSPEKINSMSYVYDEILISSPNGIFEYNKLTQDFFYRYDLITDFQDNDFYIIHYDKYRDHIWLVTNESIMFKSYNSKIWRRVYFSEIGIVTGRNVYNIGSNQDYVFIETPMNVIAINPYNGYLIDSEEFTYNPYQFNQITWSASSNSSLAPFYDLSTYFSLDDWNILGPSKIENHGRVLNVTCAMKDRSGDIWFGFDSGEIFFGNSHSRILNRMYSLPLINNLNVAYLDDENQWWIADNDWLNSNSRFIYDKHLIFICNWNEETNHWTPIYQNEYSYIESKDINSIFKLNNWLYVGTNYGLLVYDLLDDRWKLFNKNNGLADNIFDIKYYENNLYIGSDNGIYEFSTLINKPLKKVTNGNYIVYDMDFFEDILYVTTSEGFLNIDIKTYNVSLLSKEIFKEEIEVHNEDVFLTNRNKLVIYSKGVFKKVNRFSNPKGMDVCGDYIWVHNNYSAAIYSINSDYYLEYNYKDGIPGSIINSVECDSNWVWFTTNNGLSFYNWRKYHNEF